MSEHYRVVIVDDEMISRGFMEMLIKPSEVYEIAAALPFAADALVWCQKHDPPDLIIMDVMMEKSRKESALPESLFCDSAHRAGKYAGGPALHGSDQLKTSKTYLT